MNQPSQTPSPAGTGETRKLFVHYNFRTMRGPGEGSAAVTLAPGQKVTLETIRNAEREIREANDFMSCVIDFFQLLEG